MAIKQPEGFSTHGDRKFVNYKERKIGLVDRIDPKYPDFIKAKALMNFVVLGPAVAQADKLKTPSQYNFTRQLTKEEKDKGWKLYMKLPIFSQEHGHENLKLSQKGFIDLQKATKNLPDDVTLNISCKRGDDGQSIEYTITTSDVRLTPTPRPVFLDETTPTIDDAKDTRTLSTPRAAAKNNDDLPF